MDSDLYEPEYSPDLSTSTFGKLYGKTHLSKGAVIDIQKALPYKTLNPTHHYASLAPPPSNSQQVVGDLCSISATTSKYGTNTSYSKAPTSSYPTIISSHPSANIKVKIFVPRKQEPLRFLQGFHSVTLKPGLHKRFKARN